MNNARQAWRPATVDRAEAVQRVAAFRPTRSARCACGSGPTGPRPRSAPTGPPRLTQRLSRSAASRRKHSATPESLRRASLRVDPPVGDLRVLDRGCDADLRLEAWERLQPARLLHVASLIAPSPAGRQVVSVPGDRSRQRPERSRREAWATATRLQATPRATAASSLETPRAAAAHSDIRCSRCCTAACVGKAIVQQFNGVCGRAQHVLSRPVWCDEWWNPAAPCRSGASGSTSLGWADCETHSCSTGPTAASRPHRVQRPGSRRPEGSTCPAGGPQADLGRAWPDRSRRAGTRRLRRRLRSGRVDIATRPAYERLARRERYSQLRIGNRGSRSGDEEEL